MQVEAAVRQLEEEVGEAAAHGQQARAQRRLEPEGDVVALLARRIHLRVAALLQGHRGDLQPAKQCRTGVLVVRARTGRGGREARPYLLAGGAVVAGRAGAVEAVARLVLQPGQAGAVVAAGRAAAAGQHGAAVAPAPARLAGAVVGGAAVEAAAVRARCVALALVDLHLAVLALVAGQALALVTADAVHALAVAARRRRALVHVHLAARAQRARHAHALEPATHAPTALSAHPRLSTVRPAPAASATHPLAFSSEKGW